MTLPQFQNMSNMNFPLFCVCGSVELSQMLHVVLGLGMGAPSGPRLVTASGTRPARNPTQMTATDHLYTLTL